MHILFVTVFNLFVFRLQEDFVSSLLLNASLLLVLMTDWCRSLNLLTLTLTESFEF